METIFKVIADIHRFIEYKGGSRDITIHAQTPKVNEIINQIQKLYSFIDWTWAIKNNEFRFETDNIILRFVNNELMSEDKWKVVSSLTYRSIKDQDIDKSKYGFIFYYDYKNIDIPEIIRNIVTNNINFCIANDIEFKAVDNWLFYSKQPYEFTFKRLGVTKDSINIAGEIASQMLSHKIDKLIEHYLFLSEVSNNKYQ